MKSEEGQRHPKRRQYLQMTQLTHPVRRERKRKTSNPRGVASPSQLLAQQVRRPTRERKRQQESYVVRKHRTPGQPVDWRGDRSQTEQVLGVGKDVWSRIKGRWIPPALRKRQRLCIPPEDPGVQYRVPQVAWKLPS